MSITQLYDVLLDPTVDTAKIEAFSSTSAGQSAWARVISLDTDLTDSPTLTAAVRNSAAAMDVINNNTLIKGYFEPPS